VTYSAPVAQVTCIVTYTPVPVTNITITGTAGATAITADGGTLQISAAVLPTNATDPSVTWSVMPGTGNATINSTTGLLTATGNGTVTVTATANDGSGVIGTLLVTISGQAYPVITHFGTWTGSGTATAKVDIDYTLGKFVKLTLGGVDVSPANYTVANGSTVITLNESYLKTLANGNYTFRVHFTDGYADLNLTVAVPSGGGIPQTGDGNMLALIMTVALLLFGVTLAFASLRRRRQKA
jgi:LPXTG-motif cell wall-anchored protein